MLSINPGTSIVNTGILFLYKGGILQLRSRVVLGRTLGMVAGGLGAVRARGPGLGKARGWDSEWRGGGGGPPEKPARAASGSCFASTSGGAGGASPFSNECKWQATRGRV